MSKNPTRTCAGTGEEHLQSALLRFVKGPQNEPFFDLTGKLPGRGVYILPTQAAYQAALKRKAFARELETNTPPPDWSQIQSTLTQYALQNLSLARKANHLIAGLEAVLDALKTSQIQALVTATDIGQTAAAQLEHTPLPRLSLFSKSQLETALGIANVTVIGLTRLDTAWPALQKAQKARE